jgi:hypothetical protein
MQNAKTSFVQQTTANEQMSINSQPSFNEVRAENIFTMEQVMNEINTLPQNDNGEIDSDALIELAQRNASIAKQKLLQMTNRSDVNESPILRDGDLTSREKGLLIGKSGLFTAIHTFAIWEILLGVLQSKDVSDFFLTHFQNKTLWENVGGQILWAIKIEFIVSGLRPAIQAMSQSGNLLAHYITDERLAKSLKQNTDVYELVDMIASLEGLNDDTKTKIRQQVGDSGTNFNLAGAGTSTRSILGRLIRNYFNQTGGLTNYSISNAYKEGVEEGQYKFIAAARALGFKTINAIANYAIRTGIPNFWEDFIAGLIDRIGGNFTVVATGTAAVQGAIEVVNTYQLLTLDKVYHVGVQEGNSVSEVGSQAWRQLSQYVNKEFLSSSANQTVFRVFGRLLFEFTIKESFLNINHKQAMSLYEGLRAGIGMHGSRCVGQSLFNLISKQCKTLPKNINLGFNKFRDDVRGKIKSIDVMTNHLIQEINCNESSLGASAIQIRSNLLVSLTNAKREFLNILKIIAKKEQKYRNKPQNQPIHEDEIGNLQIGILELIGAFAEASESLENTRKTASIIHEQQKGKNTAEALQISFKEIFSDFNEQELSETIGVVDNSQVVDEPGIAMISLNSNNISNPLNRNQPVSPTLNLSELSATQTLRNGNIAPNNFLHATYCNVSEIRETPLIKKGGCIRAKVSPQESGGDYTTTRF